MQWQLLPVMVGRVSGSLPNHSTPLLTIPVVLLAAAGMLALWIRLSGYAWGELPRAAGDTLACFSQTPSSPLAAGMAATCDNLLQASIKSMLLYPTAVFIVGESCASWHSSNCSRTTATSCLQHMA